MTSNGTQRPVFELLAELAQGWNGNGNVGLVVGATYPEDLKKLRVGCPDMPFLIPGVGAQGGALEESVRWGVNSAGRMAIVNSSRGILYASADADYPQAARQAALELRDQMNAVLEQEGEGMVLELRIGDVLRLKKTHPCGSSMWQVVRLGG